PGTASCHRRTDQILRPNLGSRVSHRFLPRGPLLSPNVQLRATTRSAKAGSRFNASTVRPAINQNCSITSLFRRLYTSGIFRPQKSRRVACRRALCLGADSPWRASSSAISEFFTILFDMRIRINRSFLIFLCAISTPCSGGVLLKVFNIARGGQRDKELIVPQQNRRSSSANLEPRYRQLTLPRFVPLAEVFYGQSFSRVAQPALVS